ncbi:MAG: DNA translocase FtsK 4TM domain-containing protein, partial [Pseudorhodoplanes sp.]
MASIDHRNIDQVDFLSDDFRGVVRRRIAELLGLGLLVLSVVSSLALATWSVQDPSLSHATTAPIRNLLGSPGAIAADLLIQIFGLASIIVLLPLAVWGWRLITHRTLSREWLRLLFWIGAIILTAAFASCLPKSAGWPLPTGLGGVTGDALLKLPTYLIGPMSGWN